jgi:hypothetical protein
MTGRPLGAAALVLALAAAGCGGKQDDKRAPGPAPPPRPGTHVDAAGAALDLPVEWTRGPAPAPARVAALRRPVEGRAALQLYLFAQRHVSGSARRAVLELARPAARQTHGRLHDSHAVSVPGADHGWSVLDDYERRPASGGARVAERELLVSAIRGGRQWLLLIGGPRQDMTDPAIDRIVRSLRVGGAGRGDAS